MLIFCMTFVFMVCEVNAIAVNGEKVDTFIDVSKESEYYEAVEYLAEKGIVKGCGNSKFNPDSNITLNHFAIMLIRAFDDVKYEDRPLPICFNNGWIDMYTVQQSPNSDISRGSVYQSLLIIEKVDVFNEEGLLSRWSDYAKVIDNLGVIEPNTDLGNGITRGEVAQLFYYFLNNEVKSEIPNLLKGINIENKTTQNVGDYYRYFQKIPSSVIEIFKENDWKIVIDFAEFQRYKEETGVIANGLCSYRNKTIFLKTAGSLVHEFGHFVDYISDTNLGLDELYAQEGELFELYRGYKFDNSREYFAEFFEAYVFAKEDEEKLEKLKDIAPQTFEYMSNLEENDWKVVYTKTVTW